MAAVELALASALPRDSGWRDVSALLENGWAGSLYTRRVGGQVTVQATLGPSGASSHTVCVLPWRDSLGTGLPVVAVIQGTLAATTGRVVNRNALQVNDSDDASRVRLVSVSYYTDAAWPTDLPGTAV